MIKPVETEDHKTLNDLGFIVSRVPNAVIVRAINMLIEEHNQLVRDFKSLREVEYTLYDYDTERDPNEVEHGTD